MDGRIRFIIAVLGILCGLFMPRSVQAQLVDDIRVGVVHGSVFFLNDLVPPPSLQGDEVEEATFESSWGWGLDVGVKLTDRIEVEGYLLNAPSANLSFQLSEAPLLINLDTRTIYAGGNILYYFSADGVSPFIQVGVGTRSQDLFKIYGGTNLYHFAGNVGGGVAGKLTKAIGLRATLENHISTYSRRISSSAGIESSTQTDLWLTMSLQWYP